MFYSYFYNCCIYFRSDDHFVLEVLWEACYFILNIATSTLTELRIYFTYFMCECTSMSYGFFYVFIISKVALLLSYKICKKGIAVVLLIVILDRDKK